MHARTGTAGPTRSARRILLALIAAIAVAVGLLSAPAQAVAPEYRGLFGPQDPTYDGVDRQATAILGLVAVGAQVPKVATRWLLRQQCADGSFSAFRSDTATPCTGPDLTTFTGPNTNSTALAAMALRAQSGRIERQAARRATAWLTAQQQADGGWEWLAGLGSDATSTAMTLAAIDRPGSALHRRGATFLRSAMPADMNCGLTFTPDSPVVDPLSTSWTFLAAQGPLPYARQRGSKTLTPCTGRQPALRASGTWLASEIVAGNGQIPSAFSPGETDWNVTALATIGMSQRHGSTRAMRLGLSALQANVPAYVEQDGVDRPAALGTLLMVAHATNSDPRSFGGVNLTRRLLLTVQK